MYSAAPPIKVSWGRANFSRMRSLGPVNGRCTDIARRITPCRIFALGYVELFRMDTLRYGAQYVSQIGQWAPLNTSDTRNSP